MAAKRPLNLVAVRSRRDLLLSGRKWNSLCRLGMFGMNPARGRQNNALNLLTSEEPIRWNLQVDVERIKEDPEISLPLLVYVYSPLHLVMSKLNIWKLKLLWDWHFNEAQFLENARRAVVLITQLVSERQEQRLKKCTTPMGYKLLMDDISKLHKPTVQEWSKRLLRFEKRHIRRTILVKVQQLPHYQHKFAFIDVVFLACRRANDFKTISDIEQMKQLIRRVVKKGTHNLVPSPVVLAEFFVRFRRDYSLPPTDRTGQWLISTYKILKLDLLNDHPEFSRLSNYRTQTA